MVDVIFTLSLADPGGGGAPRRASPPQQDQFLSFSHTFSLKSVRIGGWRPPPPTGRRPPPQREILDPPLYYTCGWSPFVYYLSLYALVTIKHVDANYCNDVFFVEPAIGLHRTCSLLRSQEPKRYDVNL